MKVLVSGSHGLIGGALCAALRTRGDEVHRLVRSKPSAGEVRWDPRAAEIDRAAVEGVDAVVHLAGEPLVGRWSAAKKQRIRDSRVEGTRNLSAGLVAAETRPSVFVCASAIGYYGDRGDDELDEESAPADTFLAGVCRDWEAAADPLRATGSTRVIHARFGLVLSAEGGMLPAVLRVFRLGMGGVLGSGRQYMSWIAIGDVTRAIEHCLATASLAGAVNVVSPHPVRNKEFTRVLARVVRRPSFFPAPASLLRLGLGELAEEVLASARVLPRRLLESGFEFEQPDLEGALRHVLDRQPQGARP